jgi:hypothetical protein
VKRKHIGMLAGAFVAFYVLKQPDAAADVVNNAAGGLGSAADSLATFVNSLAS